MSEERRREYDHEGLSMIGVLPPHHTAADSRFLEVWLPSGAENKEMKRFILCTLISITFTVAYSVLYYV